MGQGVGAGGAHRPADLLVVVLALVVALPLLRPGWVLHRDLVAVGGDQVLSADSLGLSDRLPRQVPLDAVTWLWGWLLPWPSWAAVAVLGGLLAAGWGCARLVPAGRVATCVAGTWAVWNPWVAERLALGHAPLVLAYGALPWIARGAYRAVSGTGARWPVLLWFAVAALTPSGAVLGWVALVAGMSAAGWSRRWRRMWPAVGGALLLCLPWVLAGAVHPARPGGDRQRAEAGLQAFALVPQAGDSLLATVLGLGGSWNVAAWPDSRHTALVWLGAAVVAVALPAALVAVRGRVPARVLWTAVATGAGSVLVAVVPGLVAVREVVAQVLAAVPGAELVREGHRWLAPFVLLVAVAVGWVGHLLAQRVAAGSAGSAGGGDRDDARRPPTGWAGAQGRGSRLRASEVVLGAGLSVLAVCVVPDLAGGVGGRLSPVDASGPWQQVRAALAVDPDPTVLVLPWEVMRVGGGASDTEPHLDPAPRVLPGTVLVSDDLVVSGRSLGQEGRRARAVQAALSDQRLTSAEAADLGVGWVLLHRDQPGPVPLLPPGPVVADAGHLSLVRLSGPAAPPSASAVRDGARQALVVVAHLVAGGVVLGAVSVPLYSAGRGRWVALRKRRGHRG